jgi:hypothetical protein
MQHPALRSDHLPMSLVKTNAGTKSEDAVSTIYMS